jgi:hypothetical protein
MKLRVVRCQPHRRRQPLVGLGEAVLIGIRFGQRAKGGGR